MTQDDLKKRAAWLTGVARRVRSPEVSDLLLVYASDMLNEADRMEIYSRQTLRRR